MARKQDQETYSVLLDTSFMIRLLNSNEPLHKNAYSYFKYFIDEEITMCFSTISVAEYCVKGDFNDIPYRNIKILPFNIFDGKEAGKFGSTLLKARSTGVLSNIERVVIQNDTKLLAQASVNEQIKYFVTADQRSKKIIDILRKECNADIRHLDIHTPCNQLTGTLDL